MLPDPLAIAIVVFLGLVIVVCVVAIVLEVVMAIIRWADTQREDG